MEKINLVEILKDCPTSMELDCTMYDNVTLDSVSIENDYPIKIVTKNGFSTRLTKYGQNVGIQEAKCVIFPKGKTTWKGFVPPCKFKNGDIISNGDYVAIFYKTGTPCRCTSPNVVYYHCYYSQKYWKFKNELDYGIGTFTEFKYATEKEKQKLFNAIKNNGYQWNAETKTLEKLPKFKVGDKVKDKNNRVWFVVQISEKHFDISSVPNAEGYFVPIEDQDNYELVHVEPKFKVGDSIIEKNNKYATFTISNIDDSCYYCGQYVICRICYQDNWELVPNKFDINTLVPFESQVLVRNVDGDLWKPAIYGFSPSKGGCYVVGGVYWHQCIPYKGNEYLRGNTSDCNEYYKTWK